MTPHQNPFDPADYDRHAIWETHVRREIEAFLKSDWKAVLDNFDQESFIAINANYSASPSEWAIAFSTLTAYRDHWLSKSQDAMERSDLKRITDAMFAGCTIARLEFDGDTALMTQHFDGCTPRRDGADEPYRAQSVLTLRKAGPAWRIVTLICSLPLA